MKIKPGELKLYAVTDRTWAHDADGVLDQVEDALKGGVTFVQVREKELEPRAFLSEARWIVELCHRYGVRCVINDNVDVALLSGADGVHVGQDDMACERARAMLGENRIIGVSAHNVEQARAAEAAGADYLGCGAAFPTDTKDVSGHYVSAEGFREITSAVNIPVVAIGGITAENLPKLYNLGLSGIAVVSALFAQKNIPPAAQTLLRLCDKL